MMAFTFFLVLISTLCFENRWGLKDFFVATPELVFGKGEWYRLWTSLFVHGDGKHLLSNVFLLFPLGYFLSGYFGWILFPMTALAFGALIHVLALKGLPLQTSLIGISGVVFWLGGIWLTLFLLLERQKSWMQRLLRVVGVSLVLFFPAEAFDPQVSYRSHLIGFGLGIVWGWIYFLLRRKEFRAAEVYETVIEEGEQADSFQKNG